MCEEAPITVIIPTCGRATLLTRTLTTLAGCPLPPGYRETIVVENGGRHGAEEAVAQAAKVLRARYLYREQGNKSAALNIALGGIEDCLVVLFDDDVRIDPGTLAAYGRVAQQYRSGKYFGGQMHVHHERPIPDWLFEFLPKSAAGWTPGVGGGPIDGWQFLGCNWAAYRSDIVRCGGFDPLFGPGATTGCLGQETNMQKRLFAAGIQPLYVADAIVSHHVPFERSSPEFVARRAYRSGIARGLLSTTEARRIGGFPVWAVRRLASLWLRYLFSRMHPSPAKRLRIQCEFNAMLGRLTGYRAASSGKFSLMAQPESQIPLL